MADYQNPQTEPGNERRLLLIFLAAFVVIILFQPLFKKYLPQPAPPPVQNQPAQSQAANPVAPVAAVPPPAKGVTKQATHETETVIENDLYRITFSNRGGEVKSWILKKYDNDTENGPLDLVNQAAAKQYGYPLSLYAYNEDLRGRLSSEFYVASTEGKLTPPATLTYEYADDILSVRKTFTFDNTYIVKVDASVTYKGSPAAALPAWPAGFGDQTTPAFYGAGMITYQFNKNIERVAAKKISGGGTVPGPLHWAGPTDLYFAAVFIPDDPASATMVTLRNSLPVITDAQKNEKANVDVLGAAVGNLHGPTSARLFVGPKELEVLQKIPVPGLPDNDLNGLVDFGWWGVIAKPLFIWLKWTYHHIVPNWGWAIVLQTLIITVALLPLRITQMKSMLKMQRVAPQIKSIQEKYKKYSLRDPRKAAMNEEISAIYKREGVNPAGGCLPMLIQFPFLIAYYRMLGAAIDLRHAHWLWIKDLSAAEPFPYILPVLMVVSMLVVQRMTPQAGMDPKQQQLMNVMMPLMMGFIFFRLQAGLNLYYAEANLISIAQQSVMNRTSLGKEMREMMAKRARKKDK
ncbi:MAG TPA: membrane protein insertase YidC [Candidatus Sulfotelmatobacter sp.]|nr:membrane protein insertase YidC [Candidatus Sulfotelmatobacter sp.]